MERLFDQECFNLEYLDLSLSVKDAAKQIFAAEEEPIRGDQKEKQEKLKHFAHKQLANFGRIYSFKKQECLWIEL